MRIQLKLISLLALCLTFISVECKEDFLSKIPSEKGVYYLQAQNFDNFLSFTNLSFVCFHNDNEQMIKMLHEYVSQVAERLHDHYPPLACGMMNIEKEPPVSPLLQNLNSPDFKLFYQGQPTTYNGKLNVNSIVEWINKKTGLPSNKIDNHKTLIDKTRKIDNLIVYIGPLQILKFNTYLEVAKEFMKQDDFEFAHIDSYSYDPRELDLLDLHIFKEKGYQIRVYRRRNLRDFRDFTNDDFSYDNIRKFIMQSTFIGPGPDIVRELSQENAMKIFSYNLPVLILFRNSSAQDTRYYDTELSKAFEQIQNKILVILADINNSISQKIAALVGLDFERDSFPQVRILDPNPGKSNIIKYEFNQPQISQNDIIEFVDNYIGGKLTPYLRTEKNPISKAPQYITALNSLNFDSVAMNVNLDVFVIFIGPRCKLCSEIWPVFIKIAKVLSKTQDLVFASIDLELNELQEHTIHFFPTLRYYPKNSKHRPYDYDRGLDLQDLVKFAKRVAAVNLVEDYTTIIAEGVEQEPKKEDL